MGYQENEEDNEPAKLTEEMRPEITKEEPIDDLEKPLDTVSQRICEGIMKRLNPMLNQNILSL